MLSLSRFSISDMSSNSVDVGCGLNALCGFTAILSGTGGEWGLEVSSSGSSSLFGPQANPEAFLAWTYSVKSPVIKQLEGLLWGDLMQRGKCQSDCNQDLCRPGSWWHSATLTSADFLETDHCHSYSPLQSTHSVEASCVHSNATFVFSPTFVQNDRNLFLVLLCVYMCTDVCWYW